MFDRSIDTVVCINYSKVSSKALTKAYLGSFW